jgi:hypothetical protein
MEFEKIQRKMVSRQQAALMYDVSPGHLANLLCQGRGPKAYRCGKKVLYRIEDLEAFFTSRPVQKLDSIDDVRQ